MSWGSRAEGGSFPRAPSPTCGSLGLFEFSAGIPVLLYPPSVIFWREFASMYLRIDDHSSGLSDPSQDFAHRVKGLRS